MDKGKNEEIVLEYDLYSLPTAQHKAGLVGLIMMIDSMKARKMANVPEVIELKETSAIIKFSKESLQAIFDDLYDASWVEVESKSKWSGKQPKRIKEDEIETKDGKKKKKRDLSMTILDQKVSFYKPITLMVTVFGYTFGEICYGIHFVENH